MDYFWIGSNLSRALSGFQYSGFDLRNAQVIENARLDPVEGRGGGDPVFPSGKDFGSRIPRPLGRSE